MISFATLGESFRSFFDAINQFFSSLGAVQWGPLILALLCYGTYLTVRSRASYHVLRAAYPTEDFRWRAERDVKGHSSTIQPSARDTRTIQSAPEFPMSV